MFNIRHFYEADSSLNTIFEKIKNKFRVFSPFVIHFKTSSNRINYKHKLNLKNRNFPIQKNLLKKENKIKIT